MTVTSGCLSADIVGGELLTVRSLRHRELELLADPAELQSGYRVHASRAGITLLHPWANRLGADAFEFDGRRGRLDAAGRRVSRDAHGRAIHGLLAPSPWRPTRLSPGTAVASLTWLAEPGFPFAHQVVVRIELEADPDTDTDPTATLAVHTTVTALAGDAVPVAMGWHPYFRRRPGAAIGLPPLVRLGADPTGLPAGGGVPQEPMTITLRDESYDFGVAGLTPGSAMMLGDAERTIAVELREGYGFGQVFAPADAPVVSLEPMTAPTDALRAGRDLALATPERPYTASFTVRVRNAGEAAARTLR